jgi:hypothetical protein
MDENILHREDRLTECETTDPVDRVAGWAQQELDLLLLKRTAIAKRITLIRSTLAGLAVVFGSDVIAQQLPAPLSKSSMQHTLHRSPGLTRVCRQTLMGSQQPLTTTEIYHRIQKTNPEILARHKYPKVALSVVLRRLVTYREVCDGINEQHLRTWLWIDGNVPFESAPVHSSSELKQEGFASLDI